jgi:hypothetical protein
LFFVRGRGRGHAIAALAIARSLSANGSAWPLHFVSYGSGAETLREAGEDVIDLGLPEKNAFVETVAPVGAVIREYRPRLAVAHEEFAVPAAARILNVPCVFVTDWFTDASHSNMRALNFADEILFIDEPGVFGEPPYLSGRVRYVGPVLRERRHRSSDRTRARRELGLEDGQFAVAVFVHPGRRDETAAPVCGLLLAALDRIGVHKKILWLSGADDVLAARLDGRPDAVILDADAPFDQLMAACDLAVTKGNRNIVLELASFGVATISFSHGLNRIDDMRTSRVAGNTTLVAARLTPDSLAEIIREKMRGEPDSSGMTPAAFRDGAQGAAARLIEIAAAIP